MTPTLHAEHPTVDAAVVAEQVRACPMVAALHAGRDGSIRADTPAGPVVGVRVDRAALVVGVVGLPDVDTVRTVHAVRSAVTSCPPTLSLCVSVEARPNP